MSDRPIRVVLDTSSIIAYAQAASLDVGEVITEVDDEQGAVALPALCLIEAARVTTDRGRLRILDNNSATTIVTIEPDVWETIVGLADAGGRTDAATAALIAADYEAILLTRQPDWYSGMGVDLRLIAF